MGAKATSAPHALIANAIVNSRSSGSGAPAAVFAAITLRQELGREPTAGDVADRLGLTPEDIVEALQAGDAHSPISLDAPRRIDEDDGASRVDYLPDHHRDIARAETRITLAQLADGY